MTSHMDCVNSYSSENSRIAPLEKRQMFYVCATEFSQNDSPSSSLARALLLVSIIAPPLLVSCQPWHHCYSNSWLGLRKLLPYTYKEFSDWCWALEGGTTVRFVSLALPPGTFCPRQMLGHQSFCVSV